MAMNGYEFYAQVVGYLLWAKTFAECFENFELSRAGFLDNIGTAGAFLSFHLVQLFGLGLLEGLSRVIDVGAQGDEGAFDEGDARACRSVHLLALADLRLNRGGGVDVPDMVVAVEVERGNGDGEQRHQAASPADGEVDVVALQFEIADELVYSVERGVGVGVVDDVVDRVSVAPQDVRMKADGVPAVIQIGKFPLKTGDGVLQARLHWLGMKYHYILDGKAFFQQEIKGECHHLWLAAERCQ